MHMSNHPNASNLPPYRRLNHQATARCMNITTRSHELCQRWTTELESGGNIRFIEGTPSVPWFKSCVDLVNSRFSVGEVQVQYVVVILVVCPLPVKAV